MKVMSYEDIVQAVKVRDDKNAREARKSTRKAPNKMGKQ